jgi:thiol-disulfide isomerase/thioredoxin
MIRKLFPAFSRRALGLAAAILAAVVVAAAAVLVIGPGAADGGRPPAFQGAMEPFRPAAPPKAAAEISFTDASGRKLTLADFKGKVVLLNFWATWCVPCVEEMPSLDKLQAKLGGGRFTIVAISVDRQGLDLVRPFLAKTQIQNLDTYLDPPGASMRAFGVRGLPTTMVIDPDGREAGRIEGMARWDTPQAEALIRHYIGPTAPSTVRTEVTH